MAATSGRATMARDDHYSTPTYASSGVDEALEQSVFAEVMRPWLSKTAVRTALVSKITGLSSGYFATLLHIPPGPPLALTTDGVGTKILIAREARRYEGIGLDLVANNVNDLICVGAEPILLLDYLAIDRIERPVLEELAKGLYLGASEAGISIPGGEIAQVGAMLADPGVAGPMLDLVGTAVGVLPAGTGPDGWRIPLDGSLVEPGDVVIGLPSSGLHSNGYSLARAVLLRGDAMQLDSVVPGTDQSLEDLLLEPTAIYVKAMDALWAHGVAPHGLVHISGGGLLNLTRLAADVSYHLDQLPAPQPLFRYLQEIGGLPNTSMYETFNMGIGFCIVLDADQAEMAINVLSSTGYPAAHIGIVTDNREKLVTIPSAGVEGHGDVFRDSTS
jgi:phosphoribosylformylglycinamidine cyclo-ligase